MASTHCCIHFYVEKIRHVFKTFFRGMVQFQERSLNPVHKDHQVARPAPPLQP